MNALDSLADNHPAATGLGGAAAGTLGWFLSNIENINAVLRFGLLVVSIVSVLLTIALGIRKWIRDQREADRERFYVKLRSRQNRNLYDDDHLP